MAESDGVSQQKASAVLDALVHSLTQAMVAGESVTMTGFGTFSVANRPAPGAQPSHRSGHRDSGAPGAAVQGG